MVFQVYVPTVKTNKTPNPEQNEKKTMKKKQTYICPS
uniref:Uncharacterized protein n=1 Tax=Nelumbo nucifera TaxID=4432 RepID=A0A822YN21_NELNU|nr:TPA_asm: hypothetical protein HUJ06_012324 [Nelumbo nucifera]